jgi:hypothetical protein
MLKIFELNDTLFKYTHRNKESAIRQLAQRTIILYRDRFYQIKNKTIIHIKYFSIFESPLISQKIECHQGTKTLNCESVEF